MHFINCEKVVLQRAKYIINLASDSLLKKNKKKTPRYPLFAHVQRLQSDTLNLHVFEIYEQLGECNALWGERKRVMWCIGIAYSIGSIRGHLLLMHVSKMNTTFLTVTCLCLLLTTQRLHDWKDAEITAKKPVNSCWLEAHGSCTEESRLLEFVSGRQ